MKSLFSCVVIMLMTAQAISSQYDNCKEIPGNESDAIRLYWTRNADGLRMRFEGNIKGYLAIATTSSSLLDPLEKAMNITKLWMLHRGNGDQKCQSSCAVVATVRNGQVLEVEQAPMVTNGIDIVEALDNDKDMDAMWFTGSTHLEDIQLLHVASFLSSSYGYTGLNEQSSCAVSAPILSAKTVEVVAANATTIAEPSQYVWNAGSGFIVTWDVHPDEIVINLNASTNGWVSFGVSAMGQMSSGDFCTGWVDDKTGAVVLFDTWSPNKDIPIVDTKHGGTQDCVVVSGSQQNGRTSITYRRKISTGDKNDYSFEDGYQYVAWATYKKDGSGEEDYDEHDKTGNGRMNFFTGEIIPVGMVSADQMVVIIIVGTLLVFSLIRYCRRRCQHKEYQVVSYHTDIIPNGSEFYKGSELRLDVASKDSTEDLELQEVEIPPPGTESSFQKLRILAPKSPKSSPRNCWYGIWERRMPWVRFSFQSAMLGVIYLAIFVGSVFVTKSYAKNVGDLVAVNAFLSMLPATRNSLLVVLLGIPLDRAIMYHRWLGRSTLILATTHGILSALDWGSWNSIATNLVTPQYLYGTAAWFCALLLFVTSLEVIRRRYFEFFFYSHFLFIGFFVLGCLHNSTTMLYYSIAAGALYLIDRVFRIIWGTLPTRTLTLNVKDAEEKVVQMRFKKHALAKRMNLYKVAQYYFINIPAVSLLEWHPFSASSGPDERSIEVHIKALGNHTNYIYEKATKKEYMWVRVDGPYGNLNIDYQRFPVLLLVAGGIGITPIMGILKDLYRVGDLAPEDTHPKTANFAVQAVHLVWAVQSQAQYHWFSTELVQMLAKSEAGFPKLNISIHLTRSKTEEIQGENKSGILMATGRPDIQGIFDYIVSEYDKKATTVLVCGPRKMTRACWDAANSKRLKGHRFHFHQETFEF